MGKKDIRSIVYAFETLHLASNASVYTLCAEACQGEP